MAPISDTWTKGPAHRSCSYTARRVNCRAWEGQREAVAQRYRFIAPTQRYFGTGRWPDDGARFSMETHVDDLVALVAKLDAGPVHVVGWSYGGGIALALIARQPEWVSRTSLGIQRSAPRGPGGTTAALTRSCKTSSGRNADTVTLGRSTALLIWRSTATLQMT
jgi:pimeloyl-ACP methyl ester carboxylesterase